MVLDSERDTDSGWIGPVEVVWSLTFPDGQGPPQSIVADIRKFMPNYVPLWCTRVFVGPDGVKETFTYNVIGMWRLSPDEDCPDFHRILKGLVIPFDFPFKGGVIYEQHTISAPWPDGSWQKARMTPDIPLSQPNAPLPPDWEMYERITKPPVRMEWEKTRDWIERSIQFTKILGETLESKLDALRRERLARVEDEGKKIDADADYKIKTDGLYKRAVQNGWWVPLPRDIQPWEKKPFVHLGSR